YFFTQIPQPIQRNSEMNAILSDGFTSIQSFPGTSFQTEVRSTFLHSCAHRLGLQRFESTMAIRVILSAISDEVRGIEGGGRGRGWGV
ncbi:hypothetical protein BV20DRAFT_943955, partial [Pilatotrama ljubarskyi]